MLENNEQLNANSITDYISGKTVRATPEEVQAVQVFAKQLVEDYGYPRELITTHPQYRVKSRPSDTRKEYPVDIAVFNDASKRSDSEHIVIECKKPTAKDGLAQLKIYLTLSNFQFGVWFNGEERLYIRKTVKNGKIVFEDIPNIPNYGQRYEDIGLFKRKDLRKPSHLQLTFRTIRNYLAANAVSITRDEELAQQLINLIFCKIYDERFTAPDDVVSFRAGVNEAPSEVKSRIESLFAKVKAKYPEVIDFNDTIALDDTSVFYIVGELQNYSITDSERDVVAEAFETFIGYALKGGQGQFFTPRNVVRLIIEALDPQPDQLIIDPASGSGGFLVESLRHMWLKQEKQANRLGWSEAALNEEKIATAIHNIRGIEKDEFLSKVAKAYMAILGDGKGGIYCEDSLEIPSNWKSKTQQGVNLGVFDVVVTNPPFGKDLKVVGEAKLAQYDLAHKWEESDGESRRTNKLLKEKQPQILFVERCLQLLKDGGKLAIILPETFFHAPKMKYVMRYMSQHNITHLIDLPHNTFRPHNNAKCVVVILEKNRPQQENILMAVAEEMGHDHQGKPIYRWNPDTSKVDINNLWDDVPVIMSEIKNGSPEHYTFLVKAEDVTKNGIYVPRYYWKKKEEEIEQYAARHGFSLISISQLINEGIVTTFDGHGSPPAEYKGRGDIPYVRVKDIVNWEVYKDSTAKIPYEIYLSKKGRRKDLEAEDILYVRRGSYRIGSVAMVSEADRQVLLTREILVLRVKEPNNKYGITPYYLLYLLSHRLVYEQAFSKVLIETTLPNIGNRWSELRLPLCTSKVQAQELGAKIESVMQNKWQAQASIEQLRQELGDIIT